MEKFDKTKIYLKCETNAQLFLRSIDQNDLESLRKWKNKHKEFFFHKELISNRQQLDWYNNYLKREYDIMLLVIFENQPIGCMGIRWIEDSWDVYNIILGQIKYGGQGLMSQMFSRMIKFAREINFAPVSLKVLKLNPAVKWYLSQGFLIKETHNSYYIMTYSM